MALKAAFADFTGGMVRVRLEKTADIDTEEKAMKMGREIVEDMISRYRCPRYSHSLERAGVRRTPKGKDLRVHAGEHAIHLTSDGTIEGWTVCVEFTRPWTS